MTENTVHDGITIYHKQFLPNILVRLELNWLVVRLGKIKFYRKIWVVTVVFAPDLDFEIMCYRTELVSNSELSIIDASCINR